jgi:hypothetical protein
MKTDNIQIWKNTSIIEKEYIYIYIYISYTDGAEYL